MPYQLAPLSNIFRSILTTARRPSEALPATPIVDLDDDDVYDFPLDLVDDRAGLGLGYPSTSSVSISSLASRAVVPSPAPAPVVVPNPAPEATATPKKQKKKGEAAAVHVAELPAVYLHPSTADGGGGCQPCLLRHVPSSCRRMDVSGQTPRLVYNMYK